MPKNAYALEPSKRSPQIGDVVNYVDPSMGDVYPGIVTKALTEGRTLLTVFPPGTAPFPVSAFVVHDEEKKARGTWHWRDQ